MRKILKMAKWGATLGDAPQSFLGAGWIPRLLGRVSDKKKRLWALRILALSPHYFFNSEDASFRTLSEADYLEAEYREGVISRQRIFDKILAQRLTTEDVVIDYGCGPGFLAKIVAESVRRVYAFDISDGALACARVINPAPNLEYLKADESGLASVDDSSVDAVVSFAMVQHVTDSILSKIVSIWAKKLKSGGRIYVHIQLLNEEWRAENEWRDDTSIKGKLKFRYGLHCFGRSESAIEAMLKENGFERIEFRPMSSFLDEPRTDDVWPQHFVSAVKL